MSATKPTIRAGGEVRLKRAYEPPASDDGVRVLVDRLWPRGLDKARVAADLWLKDAAPSERLRRWFGHDPRRWERFRAEYRAELAQRADILALLADLRRRGPLTLVYGARDEAHNQAVVLREVLDERGFASPRRDHPPQRFRTRPGARKGANP
jgi:uncharacterized protein YeaO (DUF488 family)